MNRGVKGRFDQRSKVHGGRGEARQGEISSSCGGGGGPLALAHLDEAERVDVVTSGADDKARGGVEVGVLVVCRGELAQELLGPSLLRRRHRIDRGSDCIISVRGSDRPSYHVILISGYCTVASHY